MRPTALFLFLAIAGISNLNAQNIFPSSGNVGIGTNTPAVSLEVSSAGSIPAHFIANTTSNSWVNIGNSTGSMNIGIGAANPYAYIWSGTGHFFIGDDGGATVYVNGMNNGSVGIGTINTGSNKLAVDGTIGARKVVVTQTNPFPDYVFNPGYRPIPLDSLSAYIRSHRHLPEIPAADSVTANGLDLGGNQTLLLKKIEELTLYAIEQNKKCIAQDRQLASLRKELNQLKKKMGR